MRGSWKLAAAIGAVAVVVVMAGRMVLPDPAPDDVDGWIRSWLGVGLEKQAAGELQREVERDPRNLDAHYRLITLQAGGMQEQPSLEELYTRLAADEDPELADIGRYGLGLLISAGGGDPAEALAHFETVRDRELPYLNNSIGRCLQLLDRRVEAARYFERELELGGNVTGASYNLALNLIELGELDELARRATEDESFRAHIGSSLRREVALWQGDVLRYLGLMVRGTFESVNVPGLLAAVLILGIWLVFLRGLDVFEPERLHALAITLGLGMGAGIVCAIPYDLVHLVLGLSPDDSVSGSLTYCVLVVGLIEETIKLVPLLVVIRWTGWVDEPVDVAIYGATSALGFAFVENLMYFDPDQLVSIHARAFSATVLHMALTTIAAYGLILARGREQTRARTVRVALGWFMVAVVVHGLYDFVLLGPGAVALLRPLALVILLLVTLAFKNAVINGLSWSPFWNDGSLHRVLLRWRYLGLGLSAIVLSEYWLLATRFGPTAATRGFFGAALSSGVLIFILTAHLGVFEITRRRWLPLLSRRTSARSRRRHREPEPLPDRPPEDQQPPVMPVP